MNEADSSDIATAFRKRGFELSADLRSADAVVVNTCTVRQRAEDKAISQIGRLRKWKLERPAGKLFIMGCAAQRLGEKRLKAQFPFIDGVLGAKDLGRLEGMMDAHFKKSTRAAVAATHTPPTTIKTKNFFVSPLSACVTIMRGCSLKCSYCVVPSVRGEAVCIEPEAILAEARLKAAAGMPEIILLGQTVNAYRHGKTTFTGLLKEICAIKEVKRVRFMSPHPLFFDKAFFELLKNEPKISRYAHLPVQSGSDRILKLMRRGYTRAQYLELAANLRQAAGGSMALSTDFIVGYPGETERDFLQTLSLAREGGFSLAFCFKYSQRMVKSASLNNSFAGPRPSEALAKEDESASLSAEGGPAGLFGGNNSFAGPRPSEALAKEDGPEMKTQISVPLMKARLERLLCAVKNNSRDILRERIGKMEEVLLETATTGRTSSNFTCFTDRAGSPGEILKVKITGADKNILNGKVIR
ncbi:MAG: hypothetical protein A2X34_08810 [Elusimicrobia bacterium GWC2_51_8]|nr:MAG: hypothetical protein A2X33_10560 [Elusimicrobia bacterium GWA2_51_34]OGR59990.1 MAG: hypothetical protein A2X34_08810 [Elusimicrobia bacterium GWC2_51_8]HAF95185.1 hypothetical protein [Elusimicrobiota bacterium]HCE98387.1 hypothetical protein [Elusimicrobiota bacterium]